MSTAVPPAPAPLALPQTGRPRLARFVKNRAALVGAVIVVAIVLATLFAPLLAPHDPHAVDLGNRFQPPSPEFPLGTDHLGRDVLSRLLYGARYSIGGTLVAGLGISVIGLVLGLLAGYVGGWADTLISRVVDSLLAFPAFLLALALTGLLGPGIVQVTLAVLAAGWAGYTRVVRGAAVAERRRRYVEASRAVGASDAQVVRRHLLVNVAGPAAVLTTLELSAILLAISALSFLGLGVQPPTAEWGAMLSDANRHLGRAWHTLVPPGAAIFVMALGFNLVGEGLRDALDPQAPSTPR